MLFLPLLPVSHFSFGAALIFFFFFRGMVAVTKVRKFVVNLETSIDGMVTDEELLLDEGDDAEVWIRIEEATESTDVRQILLTFSDLAFRPKSKINF